MLIIDKENGFVVGGTVTCNQCKKVAEIRNYDDFHNIVWAIRNELGWQVNKVKDVWEHTCRECMGWKKK